MMEKSDEKNVYYRNCPHMGHLNPSKLQYLKYLNFELFSEKNKKFYCSKIWTINFKIFSQMCYLLHHTTSWYSRQIIFVQYKKTRSNYYCHL